MRVRCGSHCSYRNRTAPFLPLLAFLLAAAHICASSSLWQNSWWHFHVQLTNLRRYWESLETYNCSIGVFVSTVSNESTRIQAPDYSYLAKPYGKRGILVLFLQQEFYISIAHPSKMWLLRHHPKLEAWAGRWPVWLTGKCLIILLSWP